MKDSNMDWGRMSREARDAAYNNTAAVTDSAEWVARWTKASEERRASASAILDVPYGPRERNKIDLYPGANRDAPTLVYIHGGYWQRGAREWYACMGDGVAAHGWSAAMIGYTLAPDASLMDIVAEVHAAIGWLGAHAVGNGLGSRLVVAGWSAGGHLAALGLSASAAHAGLAISGVYELGPIKDTYLNDKLSLRESEIETLSPLRLAPVAKPLAIAYGSRELPPLVADSRDLHALRSSAHLPGPLIPLPGCDHFTALDDLRKPEGTLVRALIDISRER